MPVELAERIVRNLRDLFAEDEDVARFGYPDGGVSVHIELDDDGRAHVGFVMEPAAVEAFARLLDSGAIGGLEDLGGL